MPNYQQQVHISLLGWYISSLYTFIHNFFSWTFISHTVWPRLNWKSKLTNKYLLHLSEHIQHLILNFLHIFQVIFLVQEKFHLCCQLPSLIYLWYLLSLALEKISWFWRKRKKKKRKKEKRLILWYLSIKTNSSHAIRGHFLIASEWFFFKLKERKKKNFFRRVQS